MFGVHEPLVAAQKNGWWRRVIANAAGCYSCHNRKVSSRYLTMLFRRVSIEGNHLEHWLLKHACLSVFDGAR